MKRESVKEPKGQGVSPRDFKGEFADLRQNGRLLIR